MTAAVAEDAPKRRVKRLAPDRDLRKTQWGKHLKKLMVLKGLGDSEAARRAAIHMPNKKFGAHITLDLDLPMSVAVEIFSLVAPKK